MSHSSRRRRGLAVAVSGALLAASFLAAGTTATAIPASKAAGPPSTPVPMTFPDGYLMSYVLNARAANANQTAKLERAVSKAGGVVVQSWPQIGVVVAHSDRSAFRAQVTAAAGSALASVGATRTAAVSEGTPEAVAAPWGHTARKAATSKARTGGLNAASATQAAPTPDPRETEQWDMVQIKADQAHQITDGDRSVLVGVLDSGIDPDHPDLVDNIDTATSVNCTDGGRVDRTPGAWAPTTSDHGTHVAGTIGAARNGVGIVGVAPNVRMASVKVVNDDGFIYPEYAICGFVWAGQYKMDVTNNSYYIDPMMYWCDDQPDQAAVLEAVGRAVAWSTKRGTVHAAASGNAATDLANNTQDTSSPNDTTPIDRTINDGCIDIPTELPGVVTVSATNQAQQLASFSNRGRNIIDVAAPGRTILSTVVANNGYGTKSGTSMASPHVAGVLALMKSAHPLWKPSQLVAKLRSQAEDHICMPAEGNAGAACVGPIGNNSYYGEGIVDALAAVR